MKYWIQRIFFGLLAVGLFASSFMFSSQSGGTSGHLSKSILADIVENHNFCADMDYSEKADIIRDSDLYLRKAAHFTEYAVMAFAIFMFIATWRPKKSVCFGITLGFCLLAAAFDELHQSFSAGRTPALLDIGIDFAGAAVMCAVIFLVMRVVHKKKYRP